MVGYIREQKGRTGPEKVMLGKAGYVREIEVWVWKGMSEKVRFKYNRICQRKVGLGIVGYIRRVNWV